MTISLRMAFGAGSVAPQSPHELGRRAVPGASSEPLIVRPDNMVRAGERALLVDAKYKGNVEKGPTTISSADIYEALAFAQAAAVRDVVLAYPRRIMGGGTAPADVAGGFEEFSVVTVGSVVIRGVEFGVRGISRTHGVRAFIQAFARYISTIPAPSTPTNI